VPVEVKLHVPAVLTQHRAGHLGLVTVIINHDRPELLWQQVSADLRADIESGCSTCGFEDVRGVRPGRRLRGFTGDSPARGDGPTGRWSGDGDPWPWHVCHPKGVAAYDCAPRMGKDPGRQFIHNGHISHAIVSVSGCEVPGRAALIPHALQHSRFSQVA
jgi:hypothetical protein